MLAEFIRHDLASEDFRALVGGLGHDFDLPVGGQGEIATIFAALYMSVREGWIDALLKQLALRTDQLVGKFAAALLASDGTLIEAPSNGKSPRRAPMLPR